MFFTNKYKSGGESWLKNKDDFKIRFSVELNIKVNQDKYQNGKMRYDGVKMVRGIRMFGIFFG